MTRLPDKNEELLRTACSLLLVPSVSDNIPALRQVIEKVKDFFDGSPVHIHESEASGKPSLVITTRETTNPAIMLQGHLDVVPGTWEQFHPKFNDGRLYARGAVDMKAFVAVAMHLVADLAAEEDPIDIGLMITTDEEVGGANGAGRLVEEGWRTSLLINGDGGYGDAVSFAEKGIVQLNLLARTRPGQRYAPWDGESAAALLLQALHHGLSELCDGQGALTREENWGTTSCILSLQSESKTPMPPSEARASVRLYWTREERGEEIINLARRVFAPLEVDGEVVAERVYLSPDDERIGSLREIMEKHLHRKIAIKADNGASDAKWFAPLGIPIVLLRFPGDGAHTPSEWLEVNAFEPIYNALLEFIQQQAESLQAGASQDFAPETRKG